MSDQTTKTVLRKSQKKSEKKLLEPVTFSDKHNCEN